MTISSIGEKAFADPEDLPEYRGDEFVTTSYGDDVVDPWSNDPRDKRGRRIPLDRLICD